MTKQKKSGATRPDGSTKWYLMALVVLALGGMGLYLRSGVTLTPSKLAITPPPPKDAAYGSLAVEQKASATGDDARAANAAGDINKGKKPAGAGMPGARDKAASKELRQEATAAGKNSSALNAGGDLNVE
ncbi:hypothetical protein [Burkholderia sp. LMU1-1-1.1]|jgi:hypothetical protein|uniref:hypothetical protein n=1 Tax=Burkholderia sp. LMU1-1-1.1 TaxID=3135266 RepID=UPI00341444CF